MIDRCWTLVLALATASLCGCLQRLDGEAASQPVDPNAGPKTVDFNTPSIELAAGDASVATACEATTQQARGILSADCAGCHEAPQNQGNFNDILEFDKLVIALSKTTTDPNTGMFVRLLIPGDAAGSRIYFRMTHGEMPPSGQMPRPTLSDFSVMQQWINNCLDDAGGIKGAGTGAQP